MESSDEGSSFSNFSLKYGIFPFVAFTFSESSSMKMKMLWKFLMGHREFGIDIDDGASVIPSLQCQIQGLNELVSWLNSLENDIRDFKTQFTLETKKELKNSSSIMTLSKFEACNKTNMLETLEIKDGEQGHENNRRQILEVAVAGVNLVSNQILEVSPQSKVYEGTNNIVQPNTVIQTTV